MPAKVHLSSICQDLFVKPTFETSACPAHEEVTGTECRATLALTIYRRVRIYAKWAQRWTRSSVCRCDKQHLDDAISVYRLPFQRWQLSAEVPLPVMSRPQSTDFNMSPSCIPPMQNACSHLMQCTQNKFVRKIIDDPWIESPVESCMEKLNFCGPGVMSDGKRTCQSPFQTRSS
jgi:metal-sulfur cluster biosynthetic enzyme